MKTLKLTNRPQLPAGPWDNEPDFVRFNFDGYDCVLYRHHAHWCGYVLLPIVPSSEEIRLIEQMEVHGGVSWNERGIPSFLIENFPHEDFRSAWTIGFDCAHSCDYTVFGKIPCGDPQNYKNERFAFYELCRLAAQL
jgi:hypothetical protein